MEMSLSNQGLHPPEEILCISVASLIAFSFLLVFFFSTIQIIRLWADGSKLSNRKRVFIRLIVCGLVRFIWYTVSSYHLLPENFDKEYINGHSTFLQIFTNRFSYTTWEYLSHFTYLWPTALLFTANCWILINWFQIFQKEKLRQKLAPGVHSSKLTAQERRKKSDYKQKKLYWAHLFFNTIVYSLVIALTPLHLAEDVFKDVPGYWAEILSITSPEALLAGFCIFGLCVLTLYACRILGNLKLAKNSGSDKLRQHTTLLFIVTFSLIAYYFLIIASNFFGVFDIYQPASSTSTSRTITPSTGLIRTHAILRLFEIIHNTIILSILASPSLSLRAPFPSKTSEITQDWLTTVLRENGTIKPTTTVTEFSTESLYGGCHFKVARVSLKYSVEKQDDPHKTVIVKILYWDKAFTERLILYIKYLLGSMDKEAMYLTSYRIESHFYKGQFDFLRGFHTAETYYNLEDVFNNRFGMVLQDLSKNVDGQPHGFTFEDSKRILKSLAEFHAYNFHKKQQMIIGWKFAGYWTGNKREATKHTVDDSWEKVLNNFPEMNQLKEKYPDLGVKLKEKLTYLEQEFYDLSSKYKTLCHGDFKISNLFVKQPSVNNPDGKVYVIDFQWFGFGNGLIDSVYFLYTSLHSEYLQQIPELLDYYHKQLTDFGMNYPYREFLHHADVVIADFGIYTICSKWANMTATDFKQYELKVKDGLHLRSFPHMELIIQKTHSAIASF